MERKLGIILLDVNKLEIPELNHMDGLEFLPLGGMPLIKRKILDMTREGVNHFLVFHDHQVSKKSINKLRNSARRGTSLEFATYDRVEHLINVKKLPVFEEFSEILITKCDASRSLETLRYTNHANCKIAKDIEDDRATIRFFPPFTKVISTLENLLAVSSSKKNHEQSLQPIRYLKKLYDVNMRADISFLINQDLYFAKQPGVYTKAGGKIDAKFLKTGEVVIGSNTTIHRTASLFGRNIIGEDVYVDKGAQLKNCIIFDHSYVGVGTTFSDCIINQNCVYHIYDGRAVKIGERTLLSRA